jgi:hypothetical protein
MTDLKRLVRIKELVDNAESALKVAKQLLEDSMGLNEDGTSSPDLYREKAASYASSGGTGKVVEGVFDGQNMIDKKGTQFPVPANYASKSKLIPGDVLKLTVTEDGKFLYKQIGPVERKTVVGPLVHQDGRYKVLANGKAYNVLLASVTYFRAEVGDEVTLIIPMNEDTDWGAIEAVLPKFDDNDKIKMSAKSDPSLEDDLDI